MNNLGNGSVCICLTNRISALWHWLVCAADPGLSGGDGPCIMKDDDRMPMTSLRDFQVCVGALAARPGAVIPPL